MNVDELRDILAEAIPRQAYVALNLHGGSATWTFPYNIWKLTYAGKPGESGTVAVINIQDEAKTAQVTLHSQGVGSLLAVLKGVGAV